MAVAGATAGAKPAAISAEEAATISVGGEGELYLRTRIFGWNYCAAAVGGCLYGVFLQ